MGAAARVGDATAPHEEWSNGVLSEGSSDVIADGMALSGVGNAGTPHFHIPAKKPPHETKVSGGSSSVLVNGKAAARVGDPMACGATISSGSSTVIIGG